MRRTCKNSTRKGLSQLWSSNPEPCCCGRLHIAHMWDKSWRGLGIGLNQVMHYWTDDVNDGSRRKADCKSNYSVFLQSNLIQLHKAWCKGFTARTKQQCLMLQLALATWGKKDRLRVVGEGREQLLPSMMIWTCRRINQQWIWMQLKQLNVVFFFFFFKRMKMLFCSETKAQQLC